MTSTTYEPPAAPESDLRRSGIRLGDLLFKGIAILAALAHDGPALVDVITQELQDTAVPVSQWMG